MSVEVIETSNMDSMKKMKVGTEEIEEIEMKGVEEITGQTEIEMIQEGEEEDQEVIISDKTIERLSNFKNYCLISKTS